MLAKEPVLSLNVCIFQVHLEAFVVILPILFSNIFLPSKLYHQRDKLCDLDKTPAHPSKLISLIINVWSTLHAHPILHNYWFLFDHP